MTLLNIEISSVYHPPTLVNCTLKNVLFLFGCKTFTYCSGNSVGPIYPPTTHESDASTQILDSFLLMHRNTSTNIQDPVWSFHSRKALYWAKVKEWYASSVVQTVCMHYIIITEVFISCAETLIWSQSVLL